VDLVAASFAWPFRGDWWRKVLVGLAMVVLLPIAFIPLLGYAVAATQSAAIDPARGLPPWTHWGRLITDGFWVALAILLIAAPFALVFDPLSTLIDSTRIWRVTDSGLSRTYAELAAVFVLALPWGDRHAPVDASCDLPLRVERAACRPI
jgi:hypothetical protein